MLISLWACFEVLCTIQLWAHEPRSCVPYCCHQDLNRTTLALQVYLHSFPQLEGKAFGELAGYFPQAVAFGVGA